MVSNHPPRVSFIIPCYNQGLYLAEAISSAFAQVGVVSQVIVVNDGSSDHSPAVMASHPDILAIHQNNQGLAAARNAGLRVADGDFICWLDADDRLDPRFATTLVAACVEQSCDFAFCDFARIDPAGRIIDNHRHGFAWPFARNLTSILMHGGLFPPVSALGRRSAMPTFPAGMDGHADYAVWLEVSLGGARFAHVPEALALYRQHPDNMSLRREHMELSAQAALAHAARRHPDAFFAAVQELQREYNSLAHLVGHLPSTPPSHLPWPLPPVRIALRRIWRALKYKR